MEKNLKENTYTNICICKHNRIHQLYKPHRNHKPKLYNGHTYKKRERNPKIKESHQITKEESKEEEEKNKKKRMNKMAVNIYLPVITLNIHGINASIKRHRVADWTQKQIPHARCLQESPFRSKYSDQK